MVLWFCTMGNRHYLIRYCVEPGRWTKDDLPKDWGATDAILVTSIIYSEGGGRSYAHVGLDGRSGGALSAAEMFEAWATLARQLQRDETLSEGRRYVCNSVFEVMRHAHLAHLDPVDTKDFDLEDWQAVETLIEVAGFDRAVAIRLVHNTKDVRDRARV